MTPLVLTVIIPVYKTAATLDRCVESVLSQADGCELILVDDGSPDACGDLCDRWAERSDRISVVHQPNRGLSAARNSALPAAIRPTSPLSTATMCSSPIRCPRCLPCSPPIPTTTSSNIP